MLLLRRKFTLALLLAVGILAAGQFQSGYAQANRPALLEFGAGHCISCKEMAKIIEELKTTIGRQGGVSDGLCRQGKAVISAI